ncbi:MAG: hypothetical protein Q7K57_56685 [Burkholderiaceae bacterium]|nr:hypothetical protein [Burkholderiaceae bacterium]
MRAELKFLNDIAKPWDELNALLIERYAFQPDLSDVTTRVSAIATAIKHQVDILALDRGCKPKKLQLEVDAESDVARLMSDVSDAAKHVVLGEPVRQNSIFVAAMFEVNLEGHFRFLRNGVFIEHASLGRHDFMSTALSAIEYWSRKRTLNLAWSGEVREASIDFFPTAFLHFDPKYCINMSSTRIMYFCRDDAGNLQPFDPEEVRFEVR